MEERIEWKKTKEEDQDSWKEWWHGQLDMETWKNSNRIGDVCIWTCL